MPSCEFSQLDSFAVRIPSNEILTRWEISQSDSLWSRSFFIRFLRGGNSPYQVLSWSRARSIRFLRGGHSANQVFRWWVVANQILLLWSTSQSVFMWLAGRPIKFWKAIVARTLFFEESATNCSVSCEGRVALIL